MVAGLSTRKDANHCINNSPATNQATTVSRFGNLVNQSFTSSANTSHIKVNRIFVYYTAAKECAAIN
jgi:hypothetical protein